MTEPNGRISISEDRLRVLFAEFELRITTNLSEKLASKADQSALLELAQSVGAIRREQDERRHLVTDFGGLEARVEKHSERIAKLEAADESRDFLSTWQRWFFGAVCVGLVGAVVALVTLATHG